MTCKPPTLCVKPGCFGIVQAGVCSMGHEVKRQWKGRRSRASRQSRGYDKTWEKLRKTYYFEHPFCEYIDPLTGQGCHMITQEIHHKIPIAEDPELRLEWSNLQALCAYHHAMVDQRRGGAKK